MGLETGTYINSLNAANPLGTDAKSAGDDHIRLLKATIKATFPNITGAVTPTQVELNHVAGVTSAIQSQLNALAGAQPGDPTLTAIADGTLGAFSHRNKVINGGFAVNQRAYVSGAAVGAGLYGHDRWKMAASGDTYTFSTTANKTTVTIPASKVLQQVVEGLNLQSGTYVLTWEGTAQGKIGAGSLSASGVTGAITGGTDTTIEFGPGTVANVQLEPGTVATPFEHRSIGAELALCQRYTKKLRASIAFNATADTQFASCTVSYEMRAAPTVTNLANIVAVNVTNGFYEQIDATGFRFTASSVGAGLATLVQDLLASAEL